MKIAATVSRYLLGFLFTVFGLNGFLHFIPQPPPAAPLAQQFMMSAFASHYMVVVFLVQIVGGLLLLSGRFVPLAIAMLAPVLVNILNFHITMDPGNIGVGAFATLLWIVLFVRYRQSFSALFQTRPDYELTSRAE
jgi:putative oxidoreductase